MVHRTARAALLLLALVPLAAAAQTDSSLWGMVTYRGGEAANARVYIGREGRYRQVTSKFRAGKNIGYRLDNAIPGRYELLVTAPGAQPRRIWGVSVNSFEQKEVNVLVDRIATTEQEYFCVEQGTPRMDDVPRQWEGGWLQGSILSDKGKLVDGKIKLLKGSRVYRELVVGVPTLPAYFENRDVLPGLYDLEYEPPVNAGLQRIRIEKVTIAPRARTLLDTIRVPPASAGDVVVTLTAPERTVQPLR